MLVPAGFRITYPGWLFGLFTMRTKQFSETVLGISGVIVVETVADGSGVGTEAEPLEVKDVVPVKVVMDSVEVPTGSNVEEPGPVGDCDPEGDSVPVGSGTRVGQ